MKLKNFTKKKAVAFGLAFGVAAGAGGIAAAYFTASGSGTGTAPVGAPENVTLHGTANLSADNPSNTVFNSIPQSLPATLWSQAFGAGYNLKQFGAGVTLTSTTNAVTSVRVELANFNGMAQTFTMTASLYNTSAGLIKTVTESVTAPAHTGATTFAALSTATFPFNVKLPSPTVVVVFSSSAPTNGVNVALDTACTTPNISGYTCGSSPNIPPSVGTVGTVWLNDPTNGISGFPTRNTLQPAGSYDSAITLSSAKPAFTVTEANPVSVTTNVRANSNTGTDTIGYVYVSAITPKNASCPAGSFVSTAASTKAKISGTPTLSSAESPTIHLVTLSTTQAGCLAGVTLTLATATSRQAPTSSS